jgi:hypothetical protein
MGRIGFALVWVGFLFGSWVGVQDAIEVNWPLMGLAFLISVSGVFMTRQAARAAAQHGERQSENIKNLHASIERIVTHIVELDGEKEQMNPYDAHGRIDALFPEDLTLFVDARETIAHVHGLQSYAEIMNHFAAGERYLNRVWSASVDGYVNEVKEYIGRAREQFEQTQAKLSSLSSAVAAR